MELASSTILLLLTTVASVRYLYFVVKPVPILQTSGTHHSPTQTHLYNFFGLSYGKFSLDSLHDGSIILLASASCSTTHCRSPITKVGHSKLQKRLKSTRKAVHMWLTFPRAKSLVGHVIQSAVQSRHSAPPYPSGCSSLVPSSLRRSIFSHGPSWGPSSHSASGLDNALA